MAKVLPNDHGYDGEVLPKENRLKVKAKNEPEIGKEENVSNMPNGETPTGKPE